MQSMSQMTNQETDRYNFTFVRNLKVQKIT